MLFKTKLNLKIRYSLYIFILLFFALIIQKVYEYEDYRPATIIENSSSKIEPLELSQNDSAKVTFQAKHDHLSIIAIKFDNQKAINEYFQFSIKEKGQSLWYFSNKINVHQYQENKYFNFEFPEISKSKGKTYEIELTQLSNPYRNINLSSVPDNYISKYIYTKKYLLENQSEIFPYLINKISSFILHLNTSTFCFLITFPLIIYLFLKSKIGDSFYIYFKSSAKNKLKIDHHQKNVFIFLISVYLITFISNFIFLLKKQTESSEWLIYEILAFLLFFLTFYLIFFAKKISLKIYKISLLIGYLLIFLRLIYLVFISNYLGLNYLVFLPLTLIPSIIFSKKKHTLFPSIFLLELIVFISVLNYFSLEIDKFTLSTVLIIITFTLLFTYLQKYLIKILSKNNILNLIICLLLVTFIAIFSTNKTLEYHHTSFYIGPAYELSQAKSILSDVPSQYGYLSIHFVYQTLKHFGITFENFHILNQLLYIIYYLFCFLILYKIVKKPSLSLLLSVVAIFFQTQFSYFSSTLLPATGPLRFGIGLLIILIISYLPNKTSLILSTIISSFALFWSIETAIYVVPSFIFYLIVNSYINYPSLKEALKNIAKYFSLFLITSLIAFCLILYKEFQYHQTFPNFQNYIQYAKVYVDGFSSELISVFGNHYLPIIILISGLILCLHQIYYRQKKYLGILSFVSIYNVAIFSYYIHHSIQNYIVHLSLFFLIELCLIIKIISPYIKNKIIYILPSTLFLVLFFYISFLNIIYPSRLNYSTDIPIIQTNLYTKLQNKYDLNSKDILIISPYIDTILITQNHLKTQLPLNPSLETILLPNYQDKYLLPNLNKLQIGTTIVYSNDIPEVMNYLEKNLKLNKINTDTSDFFSLYTIIQSK